MGTHRLQCVLFDLYGTLVDVRLDEDAPPLWAGLARALGACGSSFDARDVRRRFQTILREEAGRGREGFIMEPVFRRLLASYAIPEDITRIGRVFRQLSLKALALRPYVVPLFGALRRSDVRIGIVSNTEAVLTRYDLSCFPMLLAVDSVVLSSEVGVRKPDPRIFRLALERLKGEPTTAVFVGNSWTDDIAGARAAGLRAIYLDAHMTAGVATDGSGIIHAAPTMASLLFGLRECGWSAGDCS